MVHHIVIRMCTLLNLRRVSCWVSSLLGTRLSLQSAIRMFILTFLSGPVLVLTSVFFRAGIGNSFKRQSRNTCRKKCTYSRWSKS